MRVELCKSVRGRDSNCDAFLRHARGGCRGRVRERGRVRDPVLLQHVTVADVAGHAVRRCRRRACVLRTNRSHRCLSLHVLSPARARSSVSLTQTPTPHPHPHTFSLHHSAIQRMRYVIVVSVYLADESRSLASLVTCSLSHAPHSHTTYLPTHLSPSAIGFASCLASTLPDFTTSYS